MLRIASVSLSYDRRKVITDLSCQISQGRVTAIIGPNGCGKSTLLKAISKNKKVDSGSIYLQGERLAEMKQKKLARLMAILPQNPVAPPEITVRELISLGRYPYLNWRNRFTSHDLKIVDWALEKTFLLDLQHQPLIQMSGGERQRTWIAMTLAQQPQLLLLDEPTTFLDIAYQHEILELINRLNREEGLTIVMVLHDLNQAARYADEIIVIHNGQIYKKDIPAKVVTPQTLFEVFNIRAKVLHDQDNNCPFFIPLTKERLS